jgi:sec-independent protein translocase protein TatC
MRDRELSLVGHLAELRRRLTISVVVLLIGSGVAFAFFRQIIRWLTRPAQELSGGAASLIFTEVTEMLATSVQVSLVVGLVLASPVILYQVVMFVAPALTIKERRYLLAFLPAVLLAFASGVAFGYFVLAPPALHFLLTFGADVATPMIRVSNIVNLMIRLLFWLGMAFETPLVMYLLAQLGIVSARAFGRFRRYWLVIAFVIAAIITPTFDPLNQALVALPLLGLYEVGVMLAWLAGRRRRHGLRGVPATSRGD